MPKAKIMKAMPKVPDDGSNPSPVNYCGGVVYTCVPQQKFRGLKIKGDKNTEKAVAWGAKRTRVEAWKEVTSAIEKHKKKKGS